jgi:hypothetical protein
MLPVIANATPKTLQCAIIVASLLNVRELEIMKSGQSIRWLAEVVGSPYRLVGFLDTRYEPQAVEAKQIDRRG